MERIKGLVRDTWKFWIAFLLVGIACGVLIDFVFFACIPITIFSVVYFSSIRYDENGNRIP